MLRMHSEFEDVNDDARPCSAQRISRYGVHSARSRWLLGMCPVWVVWRQVAGHALVGMEALHHLCGS